MALSIKMLQPSILLGIYSIIIPKFYKDIYCTLFELYDWKHLKINEGLFKKIKVNPYNSIQHSC